jgi:hypothetical protein
MVENFITIDGKREKVEIEDVKLSDESEIVSFFRDEEKIPLNKLTKYYLNENLNFLCGLALLLYWR